MRQTALLTGPIKQVMLIAPNGDIAVHRHRRPRGAPGGADLGGHRQPRHRAGRDPKLPDRGERFLRIRKVGQPDKPGLAALVPASLLLPQTSTQGGRSLGTARIAMSDGTPLGDSGMTPDPATQGAQFSDSLRSKQYPLVITVSMPRSGVVANYDDLRRIGMVMTGGIALVILLFALLLSKREPTDPNADMARAIRDDEFVPYYQPLVDLQSGRLLGAEVLVRWRRPDGSLSSRTLSFCFWSRAGWCWNSRAS